METIQLPQTKIFNKTANGAVWISIFLSLLISQNLLISAQGIGNNAGLSPTIRHIEKDILIESFNKEISEKYSGARIIDVDEGIKHIQMTRYFNNKPVRLNIVEISQSINKDLVIEPTIASKTLSSRSKIANIAKKNKAIVAINGGYFKPQTGVPLGTLMINKKIYTGPIYNRVGIGISENSYKMSRIDIKANVITNIGELKIDNVNQPRMLSTHTIVYTRDWGKTTPQSPKYGSQLVVNKNKIVGITNSSTEIPEDGFVIVGPTKNLNDISKAKKAELKLELTPNWENVNHIVSGGPYLIKDGEIYIDMTAQKLNSIGGRNPRTAVGYTKDNNLILLTADGREGSSIGLTLKELADLMKEFKCINAMNLDGGGSTVMYIKGKIVNKPAVEGGIPLSHTLTVSKKNYT